MNCKGCGTEFEYGKPGDLTPGCNSCYGRDYVARRKRIVPLDITSPDWRINNNDMANFYDILVHDPCSYCGVAAEALDHIEPSCYLSENTYENMTAACNACNYGKRDRPLLHALLWFRYAPEREQITHLARSRRPTLQSRSDRRQVGKGAWRRRKSPV